MGAFTVWVRGKGKVQLSEEHDYLADGGEGRIFAQGGVIYKIYLDPAHAIPEAKLAELAQLDHPQIVRPKDVLLDANNTMIGFTMDRVEGIELCRLFNTVFLQANNVAPDALMKLVERMQEITHFIHQKGFLIVDGNELNYLVGQRDYALPFFIDVNSYQTPHFPASAINVQFQDPHSPTFSTLTDWYTFAIVACKIFVGVHPFKGTHPNFGKGDVLQRMKANVSIFNSDTRLPAAARDFSYIPSAYRDWFVRLFEKGERVPPPYIAGLLKVVQVKIDVAQSTGNFIINLVRAYESEIVSHQSVFGKHLVVTKQAAHVEKVAYRMPNFRGHIVLAPKSLTPLFASVRENDYMLEIADASGKTLDLHLKANRGCFVADNTLYVIHNGDLTEIALHELNNRPVASVANTWKIMPQASKVFDGLIFQTVLGKSFVVIPYRLNNRGFCAIRQIPELDDYRIMEGKHDARVCMLIGVKNHAYHRLILRFSENYEQYDLRVVEDIEYSDINFVTLASGVVVSLDEHGEIEMFSSRLHSGSVKRIHDPAIRPDMRLSKDGSSALFARGDRLYSLKMV